MRRGVRGISCLILHGKVQGRSGWPDPVGRIKGGRGWLDPPTAWHREAVDGWIHWWRVSGRSWLARIQRCWHGGEEV